MSVIKSVVRVGKVVMSEVPNVFRVELLGLEGETIKRLVAELPKQVQVFREGEVVEVEVSNQPISWGDGAELYLSGRVFAAKRGDGGEHIFYLSVGGLQLRLVVEGVPLKVEPLSKVYVAFKAKEA
ncbi:MAG: hypothetical protein QXT74_04775 [Candidatus Nezhaarchaeales archaeon]